MRIAEVVSQTATFNADAFNADSERVKAQQRAALTLKLRRTQQQLSQLAAQ